MHKDGRQPPHLYQQRGRSRGAHCYQPYNSAALSTWRPRNYHHRNYSAATAGAENLKNYKFSYAETAKKNYTTPKKPITYQPLCSPISPTPAGTSSPIQTPRMSPYRPPANLNAELPTETPEAEKSTNICTLSDLAHEQPTQLPHRDLIQLLNELDNTSETQQPEVAEELTDEGENLIEPEPEKEKKLCK